MFDARGVIRVTQLLERGNRIEKRGSEQDEGEIVYFASGFCRLSLEMCSIALQLLFNWHNEDNV